MNKKELIRKMKAEANKAMTRLIASTFDQNERNRGIQLIQKILAEKISEVNSL
jgi:hypothetical protein